MVLVVWIFHLIWFVWFWSYIPPISWAEIILNRFRVKRLTTKLVVGVRRKVERHRMLFAAGSS
jgi:hypothetical protein